MRFRLLKLLNRTAIGLEKHFLEIENWLNKTPDVII